MRPPQPRVIKYSDSSSSGSRQLSSNPSGLGQTDKSTPRSNQSKLTVQLTPVKAPSGAQPGEEQTLVAVRLLSLEHGEGNKKPDSDRTHAHAASHATQGAVQSSSGQSTHVGSSGSGKTAIWAAQPPASVDMRGMVKRPSPSPASKASTAKLLSPKMSPIRRFAYAPQNSAPASAYSLERFQVSPLKPSPRSPPYVLPPQQHAYTPWAVRSPYLGPQMPAGPQQPPWGEGFGFPDPFYQEPYPAHSYIGAARNIPGPQHELLFTEYSMPPQEQFIPGTAQPGMPEQSGFFAHEPMLTTQQGLQQPAYVQGAYSPQQHVPPLHEVAPGLQQQYTPSFPVCQAGEHSPLRQDMGMQWWAGPAGRPYEHSPKVS